MRAWLVIMFSLLAVACSQQQVQDTSDDQKSVVIDVRTQEEYQSGHIPEAHNIPHDQIGEQITEVAPDKKQKIILYCRSGNRAGIAQKTLVEMGYSNVINAGGYEDLQEQRQQQK